MRPSAVPHSKRTNFREPTPSSRDSGYLSAVRLLRALREPFWPGWTANIDCGTGPVTLYWSVFYRAEGKPQLLLPYGSKLRAAAEARKLLGAG